MGYSGSGKISGHTGTEHKHRKAFLKIKSYRQSNYSKSGESPIKSSIPTDYQQAYRQDRKFRLLFKLPVFLITVMLIGFIFIKSWRSDQNTFILNTQEQIEKINSVRAAKNLKAYTLLVNTGYYYLQKNELYSAYTEFVYALALDKYGKDARIGLTVTMLKRCQQYHEVCDQVQKNLDFLNKMKYLKKDKIRELEEQLNIVVKSIES